MKKLVLLIISLFVICSCDNKNTNKKTYITTVNYKIYYTEQHVVEKTKMLETVANPTVELTSSRGSNYLKITEYTSTKTTKHYLEETTAPIEIIFYNIETEE